MNRLTFCFAALALPVLAAATPESPAPDDVIPRPDPAAIAVPNPPSAPVLSDIQVSGECQLRKLAIVTEADGSYLVAHIASFAVSSEAQRPIDRQRCTLDYTLTLDSQSRLEALSFDIRGGTYALSDEGTARLTLSQRIANGPTQRVSAFYPDANEGLKEATIDQSLGEIPASELTASQQVCGAILPIASSLFLAVSQPSTDSSRGSSLALGSSEQDAQIKLAKLSRRDCPPPTPTPTPA